MFYPAFTCLGKYCHLFFKRGKKTEHHTQLLVKFYLGWGGLRKQGSISYESGKVASGSPTEAPGTWDHILSVFLSVRGLWAPVGSRKWLTPAWPAPLFPPA